MHAQAIHLRIHPRIWSLVLFGVAALLLVGQTKPVLAHVNDRALQGENITAGPYRLSIWTAPARLRTGEIHVETMVFDQNGKPDKKCAVYVELKPLDPSLPALAALSVPMTGVTEGVREAAFNVTNPGRYLVEATVIDGSGEGGRTAFEVEIIRVSRLVHSFIYLSLGASFLVGVWMLRKGVDVWFSRK